MHQQTNTERGYGLEHQRERKAALPGATCEGCGCTRNLQRDHRTPVSLGGSQASTNKRWLCSCPEHGCHARLGVRSDRARDAVPLWDRTLRVPTPVVRIVGQPGVGKSTLRVALERDLGISSQDITDHRMHLHRSAWAWSSMRNLVDRLPIAIVESAGTSDHEARFLSDRASLTIAVRAGREVRRARLERRPEAAADVTYVDRLLDNRLAPDGDLTWRGEDPIPGPAYDLIVSAVRSFVASVALTGTIRVEDEVFIGR